MATFQTLLGSSRGVFLALVLVFLASSCQQEAFKGVAPHSTQSEESLRAKARSIWKSHERVAREALEGREVSDRDFSSACDFFYQMTGILILTDMTHVGVVATKYSQADFGRVLHWYDMNGRRLYWDEEKNSVILKPRTPDDITLDRRKNKERAGQIWRSNEREILRAAHGLSEDPDEFRRAWKFFQEVAKIEVPADSTSSGVLPNKHTIEAMGTLKEWYGLHHNDLYWSEEAGRVLPLKKSESL